VKRGLKRKLVWGTLHDSRGTFRGDETGAQNTTSHFRNGNGGRAPEHSLVKVKPFLWDCFWSRSLKLGRKGKEIEESILSKEFPGRVWRGGGGQSTEGWERSQGGGQDSPRLKKGIFYYKAYLK